MSEAGPIADAAENGTSSAEPAAADTRCQFEHPFFQYFHHNGGGKFRFDEVTGGSAFVVRLDDRMEFTLPVGQLALELGLHDADTPDAHRLRKTAEAVSYVESLELGAELPSEVVSGKPSWPVPEQYLRVAKQAIGDRLSAVVARIREAGVQLPEEVANMLASFGHAEATDGSHAMTLRTDGVVEEYAYVLCLRHRFSSALGALRTCVGAAANALTPETPAGQAAGGLLRVIEAATKRLEASSAGAETEFQDIVAVLRDPGATCARLTERRNQLYVEVRRLEAAAAPWRGIMPGSDATTKELIFRTYRQMGRRDLPADTWAALESRLAMALLPRGAPPRPLEAERVKVWFEARARRS